MLNLSGKRQAASCPPCHICNLPLKQVPGYKLVLNSKAKHLYLVCAAVIVHQKSVEQLCLCLIYEAGVPVRPIL